MGRTTRLFRAGLGVGQTALVGVLCGVIAVAPAVDAQQASGTRLPVEKHLRPLTEQERVLQALNRFTFGPRPGDVAAVERVGVQRWFEMQLHPERVDDSAFGVEMGQFPAMGLPAEQLKLRFPSVQMIRQMSKRGESVPSDPVESMRSTGMRRRSTRRRWRTRSWRGWESSIPPVRKVCVRMGHPG